MGELEAYALHMKCSEACWAEIAPAIDLLRSVNDPSK